MKRAIRKTEYFINDLPRRLYLFKISYSEKKAIRKKKPLYNGIHWSDSRQKEFDDLWIENYGKKIKPYWNKLYESMNGVYCRNYFPEMLYSTKLEPLLNPPEYCKVISDKSLTETLYGAVRGVTFPETLLVNSNGVFLDGGRNVLGFNEAIGKLCNAGACVIKPTVETGSGKGVLFLNISGGKDSESGADIESIFKKYDKDFIIQLTVKNNKQLSALYPASLNTFRIITYICGGKVRCAPVSLRIGAGKNRVDNIHKGGLVVGVNADGTLKKFAYKLGYGDKSVKFTAHPDTNTVFENYYIGEIEKMISAAEELHAATPQLGIISWDLTFDESDNIVLIEANCRGQSVWFPQIVNECPIFGEDTPYMINRIKP